jgi:hypothetical protein
MGMEELCTGKLVSDMFRAVKNILSYFFPDFVLVSW